jgi:peptide/nickel transport system substrate-binding protein
MAFDSDPTSLDPHEHLSENTLQFSHWAFDPLLRWNKGKFEPRLATKWERIDQSTVRFFLREDVTFHSGHAFSAHDVAYTIQRLKQSPDFRAMYDSIESTTVISDHIIDVHTKAYNPILLNVMAYVFPMDKIYYQGKDEIVKFGDTFASRHVSGTGPFTLVDWKPGNYMELKRNPNYWDIGSAGNVDRVILTPILNDSTRLAALLSGDVDFIFPISPLDIARTKKASDVQVVSIPSTRTTLLQMNQNRREEFKDIRVRKAINLAINQSLIVEKILKSYGTPAGQLNPDLFTSYVSELQPKYDLQQALELMKQAGYEAGFRVSMMAPNNGYLSDGQVAQAIRGMLAKIHITVDLKTLPKAQYFQEFANRSADIMMLRWQSDTMDANNPFEFIVACPDSKTGFGAYNASGYCKPSIDMTIQQINREVNPDHRTHLLQQIERTLDDEAVIVPLYWQPLIWAAKKEVNIAAIINPLNHPYLGDLVIEHE